MHKCQVQDYLAWFLPSRNIRNGQISHGSLINITGHLVVGLSVTTKHYQMATTNN